MFDVVIYYWPDDWSHRLFGVGTKQSKKFEKKNKKLIN